jgi:hypothetical protein
MPALGVTICHDFIARLSCLVNIKLKPKLKTAATLAYLQGFYQTNKPHSSCAVYFPAVIFAVQNQPAPQICA